MLSRIVRYVYLIVVFTSPFALFFCLKWKKLVSKLRIPSDQHIGISPQSNVNMQDTSSTVTGKQKRNSQQVHVVQSNSTRKMKAISASCAHNDGSPSAAEASTQEESATAPYGSAVPQQRSIAATQRTTDLHDLPLMPQIVHKTSQPPKEGGHPRKRSSTENNDDVDAKKMTGEMEMKSKPKQNACVSEEITQATQEFSSAPRCSKHADMNSHMKKKRSQMRVVPERELSQTQTEQSNSEKHDPSSCETTQSTSQDISLMGDHESAFDADDCENWKYLDTLDDVKSIEKEETPSPR